MSTLLEREPDLAQALRGELTPKFLVTRDGDGVPNVVPLTSLQPADDGTDRLFFGNFLLRKSVRNLAHDSRTAVMVVTPELKVWVLACEFVEFQQEGPFAERQRNANLLRYNAYTGIRNAGVLRIRSLAAAFRISKAAMLAQFVTTRAASWRRSQPGAELPNAVLKELARLAAVKAIGWVGDDGWPCAAPALSMQPSGKGALVCWLDGRLRTGPRQGAEVAVNVLTMDAVSYQVKGQWTARGRTGAISVREAYAGGPPLPGGRIV